MPTPIRQLNTQTHYLADGVTTAWPFSFTGGYISADHVRAQVRDLAGLLTELSVDPVNDLIGEFQLRVTPPVASGHELRIYRSTPRDVPLVDFTDGSQLPEVNLDILAKQSIFVAAESADLLGVSTTEDLTALAVAAGSAAAAASASQTAAATSASTAGAQSAAAAASAAAALGHASTAASSSASAAASAADAAESVSALPVSAVSYGASTAAADNTAFIQAALDAHPRVTLPEGVWRIDPGVGLRLRSGQHLTGAGKNKTILLANAGGGTVAELAAYSRGSLIKRAFNPAAANAYVVDVRLADFSVVMTHPTGSVTTTAVQIALDLRNITRSTVERVHVGNIAPIGGPLTKASNGAYDIQGYGIVLGTVNSGSASYAGGEVNVIRDCSVWGAHKAIPVDDATLAPLSSAHATAVVNCDVQAAHHLLVQESQYTAGCSFRDNVLQNAIKQPGDASNAYIMRVEGYNNEASGGYIEAGPSADYLCYLGANSKANRVRLSYYSATNAAQIVDAGSGGRNTLEYFGNTGAIPGGVDPFGPPITLYNRGYRKAWVKFHWDGAAVVIDGGHGYSTVTRTATGDYTVTWLVAFPTDDYGLSVLLDTNASGHPGGYSIGSHSTGNVRIYTYAQNAAVTTSIDPRFVWVSAEQ